MVLLLRKVLPRADGKYVVRCYNYCHRQRLSGKKGITTVRRQLSSLQFFSQGYETDSLIPAASTEDDHPEDLQKKVLADLVRNLHRDLATAKSQLKSFGLPERGSVIAKVLEVTDTSVATQANTKELHQRSVSCTVRPNKIDEEWEKQVEESDETYKWWADQDTNKFKPKHASTKSYTNLEKSQPHQGQRKQRQDFGH